MRQRGLTVDRLLIANRGEIAIRIARAAAELGITTVAVYSEEDGRSLHRMRADESLAMHGRGVAAYLDVAQLVDLAKASECDAVHPGYGFLSENSEFAAALDAAGIGFVGPTPETLSLLGDKVRARKLAGACDVPILSGSSGSVSLEEAQSFLAGLSPGTHMLIKAVSGGGGRGMRVVTESGAVAEAFARCTSEAQMAFANPDVYVEEFLPRARHVEVQILGDGSGAVSHLWERECSIQRRHQKVVEVAPSPSIGEALRGALTAAAVRLGEAVNYRGLGTVEFMVDADGARFAFIEANARLQVEHTVTEAVTGIDLVVAQLQVARGRSLGELGLQQKDVPKPRGFAVQARINMETLQSDGSTRPAGGTLTTFEVPTGPGLRTDTFGYAGYTTSPAFDSLLAKLVVYSASSEFSCVVRKAYRSLCETRIEGVATNLDLLRNLFVLPEFETNDVHTQFIDENVDRLIASGGHPGSLALEDPDAESSRTLAGVKVSEVDPLAVLDHGKSGAAAVSTPQALSPVDEALERGIATIDAPMQGTVVAFEVALGDEVFLGKQVLVIEAMKMEHVVQAQISGVVQRLGVEVGDTVFEGHPLVYLAEQEIAVVEQGTLAERDLDFVRPDLQEVFDRKAAGYDENRPVAVAKRRKTKHRTARENVADLCDVGTFVEYGAVVVAGQRRRRSMEDLIENTTGDGMVCGLGQVNGALFSEDRARTLIMSYDYMVLAGTQGIKNHDKKDRLFELAEQYRLPTVLFAEGGGGRPGDTDSSGVAGLDCWAFTYFARLSGLVPVVGITTGRCFAGNAVLLACCDVIIATEDSNIGIGGPAMIEGGGLGIFTPEEVGPMEIQVPNGVVDIAVVDEAEAVAVAKKYLSYFQGSVEQWEAPDQRELRFVVPENRLRYYDMRDVVHGLADVGSVLEVRQHWGPGIITAFIRVEGVPIGVIANNPGHLSGAIDADGADKGARFMQLCDAFDIPILTLCDCPGIMVGPESEKSALVRHAGRMFVVGANIDVPLMTIVIRKGYGLGAQAMAGGSFKAPVFTVTWPTGEFGGMGLEGAVKLGFRKELQAISDPEERNATYQEMVANMYERGKAVNMASHFELDDVIDPADSRKWIAAGLRSLPPVAERQGKKRPNVDTW